MEAVDIAQFIIFYIAFVSLLLLVSAFLPIDIIEGITQDEIDLITENVELPAEPGVIDYVIFPFAFIYSILSKIILLLKISSAHQFIAFIIGAYSIGLAWKVMRLVRGGG